MFHGKKWEAHEQASVQQKCSVSELCMFSSGELELSLQASFFSRMHPYEKYPFWMLVL